MIDTEIDEKYDTEHRAELCSLTDLRPTEEVSKRKKKKE